MREVPGRALRAGVAAAALVSCVGLQPKLGKGSAPEPDKGYVAGTFATSRGGGFAVVLTDAIGRQFRISFGEGGMGITDHDLTGIVALTPGDYRVTHWMTYERGTGGAQQLISFPRAHPLTQPFELKAGHVVYLGSFDVSSDSKWVPLALTTWELTWAFRPRALSADEVPATLAKAYPGFASAPAECLLCAEPAPGATTWAAPAFPPSPEYGRKDLVLHYHRADGRYDGWGLWVWESFEVPADVGLRGGRKADGDRALVGVSWDHPLLPAGTDAFGAYWSLDARNFGNGRVNYVIHQGPTKEQGGRDMFWLGRDSKEAWVNEGDPAVYLTHQDAEAARRR